MTNEKLKEVTFGQEAHDELLKGATILAKAVRSTMGPGGHNVIIDLEGKSPLITKDGVTVARSIKLNNKLQSIGAELLKEIAAKTNEICGDGTTTSCVLGHGLLSQGIKMIATGRSSIGLKRGIDLASKSAVDFLKENAIPISHRVDIVAVGKISANGDESIGALLADAIEKVGSDGIITVETAKNVQTTLDIVEGMQIESGYISPFFVTNKEKLSCELDDPYILITNKKISALEDIVPVLEKIHQAKKPLLIIADDVEGEALHTLIVNKMKNTISVCAVKAPSFGENRTDVLQDVCTVTGGTVFDASSDKTLKKVDLSDLGSCKKVIVYRGVTTFVGKQTPGTKEKIEAKVNELRTAISDGTLDELRSNRYRKRLAKLSGGVAIVKVGGATEIEILEKKDRVEDALNATVAATQEGIVPGGGSALFFAANKLREEMLTNPAWKNLSDDEKAGIEVVIKTCEMPLRTIVENTGESAEVVIKSLLHLNKNIRLTKKRKAILSTEKGKQVVVEWENPIMPSQVFVTAAGYNAATKQYDSLVKTGIIDPVKVTRYALEHACSIVGLMLTCDSVVINKPETAESKEKE